MCYSKVLLAGLFFATNLFANVIKIALVAPLSGKYAEYGYQLAEGAAAAVDSFNQSPSNKYRVELIPFDDKCDPIHAKNIANLIVNDRTIAAVIGHVCSESSIEPAMIYSSAEKPQVLPLATNVKLTGQGITSIFRMCGRDDWQAARIGDFIDAKLNSKRVAIVHNQTLYGQELADYVALNLAVKNNNPVLYQGLENKIDTDKLLHKLKALKVDAIFYAGLYPELAAIASNLYKKQVQIPLITGDGIALDTFAELAGAKAASGVMMSFVGGMGPNIYISYGYAAVEVVVTAVQATKTVKGKTISNWLHSNIVDTVLGQKAWDQNGDIIDADYSIYAWGEGRKYHKIDG